MSRIDEPIADGAPGARYVDLSEVAEYSPTRVDAADLDRKNFVGVDNLLPNKRGRLDATYPPNTARLTAYEPGDILLGNIRPYLKKVWLATNSGGCSGDVLAVRVRRQHRELLDPTFLYYLLSSDRFFAYNMQKSKGAKMPRGDKAAIMSYRIPVPTIEAQRKIVRILDQFTQLEVELEAELKMRRRQFEHYRGALILERDRAETALLGDIATIGTGSHDTQDAQDDGRFIFYARGREPLKLDTFDFEEDAIITAGDGVGVGRVFHFARGKYALHQRAYRIVPHARVDARFIYHYLLADFSRYLERTSVHASVTSLRRPMFLHYPVALPSLDEQRCIVATLDKFDALVNDPSVGLPAELAARRRQYEYYRDKLLTFEEAPA
ncbi:restriction endonuclease subunit S [Microbacterium sp. T32]|uniref:restriction endonuclease subunit S n=1 Tax=Microbacterium sp. T32 TaxID=1776083 RepID=UPI0009EE8B53|nr:restriction endonuclease subunit S [Microbacterium sp. T32]